MLRLLHLPNERLIEIISYKPPDSIKKLSLDCRQPTISRSQPDFLHCTMI